MQDPEMSDVEKFRLHDYTSVSEFNSLTSAFVTDHFSSISDDIPLSNNFGCYNDLVLGNINDEKEIQRELGFYFLEERELDPIIHLDSSSPSSNLDETVNIPEEILESATNSLVEVANTNKRKKSRAESATNSNSLVEVANTNKKKKSHVESASNSNSLGEAANADKRKKFSAETKKSTEKTKRKSKTSKEKTKKINLDKSSTNDMKYFSQAAATVSTNTSKAKSDEKEPIPKLIIKLTPRPTVPDTSNSYFAPTIADKVKMGRRRQTNKLPDYEFTSMLQTFEKTRKKSRKRQKNPLISVNEKTSSPECVKSSDQLSYGGSDVGNQLNSKSSTSSLNSSVAVTEMVSDTLISIPYNKQSNYETHHLNVKKSGSETGVKNVSACQNLGEIIIKKEINVSENTQMDIKENDDLETFENFAAVSSIEIVKEEPLYDECNLLSELFDPDMRNFLDNSSALDHMNELEKVIFDEESKQASMNGFHLEEINTTGLFDSQIHPKSNDMNSTNIISSLNLSGESSKIPKMDDYASNYLSSAETTYKSKFSYETSLPSSSVTSKVVLENIEVSTPELELELYEHNSPDIMLPVNTLQVPYGSADFSVTQVLSKKSLNKKERLHHREIQSFETVPPLHPNISRRRKLSSSSSSCSQSSYSCYSSNDLPNSSSSPNSCFSPGKRQRRNSRSHSNYDKKQSSRHFRPDVVSCTNYENHAGSPKSSPQCPLDNQGNFRHRNVSGSSSSSQSSASGVGDHNHYRSLSKPFNRDNTGSRSRSTSHSQKYRSSSKWKSSPSSDAHRYQIDQRENFEAIEERRVLYVGDIPLGYTVKMLTERFSRFGPIEDVQIKSKITNCVQKVFGFVTFKRKDDAFEAIEKGNDYPLAPKFDLNFGGRRRFCNGDYTDLDGKVAEVEGGWYDYKPKPVAKDDDEDVFATLLAAEKARQESIKKKKHH